MIYGNLWSPVVPGTLAPNLPPIIEPSRWRWLRRQVAEGGAKWRRMGAAISECGNSVKVFSCKPCGHRAPRQIVPILCMSRYCVDCSKAKRQRTQARVRTVLGGWQSRVRFLTLTVRTQPTLLASRTTLVDAWKKLRRRKWWTENVTGGLAAIETTLAKCGFHPHVHALLDGGFMAWARLVDEWMSCTGCKCHRSREPNRRAVMCCREAYDDRRGRFDRCTDPLCECTGAASGPAGINIKAKDTEEAIREVAKYAAKELGRAQGKDTDGRPRDLTAEELAEFLRCTVGRRLLATFGIHYDLELERSEEDTLERELDWLAARELDDQPNHPLQPCRRCGVRDFEFTGIRARSIDDP